MSADDPAVTIVTQVTVRAGCTEQFEAWLATITSAITTFPGFLHQTRLPPGPPAQDYWVVMQRFADVACATVWLTSPIRSELLTAVQPFLTGRADVHVLRGMASAPTSAPVSAIMSTRVKPGCEFAYRQWEQKIAIAQMTAKGLIGYRFEPPIEGIQADWLTILRFDTQESLQEWLDSPVRHQIVAEAEQLTEGFHYRVTRSGFDQWFPVDAASSSRPVVWKQNMVVLLMLYPVVFLFGRSVQVPVLQNRLGIPFPMALLAGNIVSIVLLNWLVPWISRRFRWWLTPTQAASSVRTVAGAAIIATAIVVLSILFSKLI